MYIIVNTPKHTYLYNQPDHLFFTYSNEEKVKKVFTKPLEFCQISFVTILFFHDIMSMRSWSCLPNILYAMQQCAYYFLILSDSFCLWGWGFVLLQQIYNATEVYLHSAIRITVHLGYDKGPGETKPVMWYLVDVHCIILYIVLILKWSCHL